MTDNEKKILNGFLGKTLKLSDEVLASLYNDAGELTSIEPALKADETRIADHKKENTNQYNRGLKEASTKLEKSIRDQFGVDSDKIGIELVEEVVLKEKAKVSKADGEVDEKHPKIIELKSQHDKALKEKDKELAKKLEEQQTGFNKMKNVEKIKEMAWVEIQGKNPILPEDAKKATTWKNTFLREIEQGNYQINEDGTIVVLDKEGKPATDPHGHLISFNDHIVELSDRYFEFPAANTSRSSAGTPPPGQGGKQTVKTIKNQDEFANLMRTAKTTEERANLTKQWVSQQKTN
jgi:hypothetical protein